MKNINANFIYIINNKSNLFKFRKFSVNNKLNIMYFLKKVSDEKNREFYTDRKNILSKFESVFGFVPNLKKLNVVVKNKKKFELESIIYVNAFVKKKYMCIYLEREFILNFYLYFLFILNHNHKYSYLEEIMKNYYKKKILFNSNNITFFSKIYSRWTDIKRSFINTLGKYRKFKVRQKFLNTFRKLKFFDISLNFYGEFNLFILHFILNLIKNYYKIILFLYLYFRNKNLKY